MAAKFWVNSLNDVKIPPVPVSSSITNFLILISISSESGKSISLLPFLVFAEGREFDATYANSSSK